MVKSPGLKGNSVDSTTVRPSSVSFLSSFTDAATDPVAQVVALADPQRRAEAARLLAHSLGAEDLLIFILDPDIKVLLPAPGFPQTLPEGTSWQAFLSCCVDQGSATARLRCPHRNEVCDVCGMAGADGSVMAALGGSPRTNEMQQVRVLLPLLAAAFRGELIAATAQGESAMAHHVAAQARTLAGSLDHARRHLGEALVEADSARRRFARFMKHLPGLAWIKDFEGRYVYANEAAMIAFGLPEDELLGKTDAEVFPTSTALTCRASDRSARENATGIQVVETIEHADGTRHHSLISKFLIPGSGGAEGLIGSIAIDITDLKRAEDALKQRSEQLAEADRRKDEFLAMLAHELRNPLAPVRNALQIIKLARTDAALVEEAREMAERQIYHLTRLVDDLMDVSRITRGKIQLRKRPVDVATVISSALEASRPLIETRRHELTVTFPPETVRLNGDPTRLAQIVTNLLNNAAKYTEEGGNIWLTAEREGASIVITVGDTGVGITAEMLPRIFDMFTQVERSLDRSQGGLGIGLTLVRRLVEMHGGTVHAHSAGMNRGSEFIVRLPVLEEAAAAPPRSGGGSLDNLPSRRVLVVDDNFDAAISLAMLLRMHQQEVQVVHDGREALAAIRVFGPDIVLLDIGLPGMDGYEVARQVRSDPATQHSLLVAISGYGQEDDRRRSHDAGFNHHLVKPVDFDRLRGFIERPFRDSD
jgi:PAS domain S-box-containing protein